MTRDNMLIYKLTMTTQNPSANRSGYFNTKEEVDFVVKKFVQITEENREYYGQVEFSIEKIPTGEAWFE